MCRRAARGAVRLVRPSIAVTIPMLRRPASGDRYGILWRRATVTVWPPTPPPSGPRRSASRSVCSARSRCGGWRPARGGHAQGTRDSGTARGRPPGLRTRRAGRPPVARVRRRVGPRRPPADALRAPGRARRSVAPSSTARRWRSTRPSDTVDLRRRRVGRLVVGPRPAPWWPPPRRGARSWLASRCATARSSTTGAPRGRRASSAPLRSCSTACSRRPRLRATCRRRSRRPGAAWTSTPSTRLPTGG